MLYALLPAGHEGPPNFSPEHFPRVPFLSIFLNALCIQLATIFPLYMSFLDSGNRSNLFLLHGYQHLECYVSHPPDEV